MVPADIRLLKPEEYEFLWRTILRREHGAEYRHIDGHGLDCLTGAIAYQIYHHQGASWDVVKRKFHDDLEAALEHRTAGRHRFSEWVFVTTFAFKDPSHREWLDEQKATGLPLAVNTWGDEDLCGQLARHPDLAGRFGLGPGPQPAVVAGIHAQGGAAGGHGINIVGGVRIEESGSSTTTDLEPKAVRMLEVLLEANDESLRPAMLRGQVAPESSESEFKLLVHGLTVRGFVRESRPLSPLDRRRRVLSRDGPDPPPTVHLTSKGKTYLVQRRERLAAEEAKRQEHFDVLKGFVEANQGLRRRNPWRIGDRDD